MAKKPTEISVSEWKGGPATIVFPGKPNITVEIKDGSDGFYIPSTVAHQFVAKINITGLKLSELILWSKDAVAAMDKIATKAKEIYADFRMETQDHGISSAYGLATVKILMRFFPKDDSKK